MSFRSVKKIFVLGRLQSFSQNMGEAKEKNMENVTEEEQEEEEEQDVGTGSVLALLPEAGV